MTKVIEICDLSFSYGSKKILHKINLNIEINSFTTLMGSSGCGKSLLTFLLRGILPYDGQIKILNEDVANINYDSLKSGIVCLNENFDNEIFVNTVKEELLSAAAFSSANKEDIIKIVNKLKIKKILSYNPHQLSGGEKQLVALARAMLIKPKILILDNALCMLDGINRSNALSMLKRWQKQGLTIINITNNAEDILISDRLILVDGGNIVLDGDPKRVLNEELPFYKAKVSLPFVAALSHKLKYYQVVSKIELNHIRLVRNLWK